MRSSKGAPDVKSHPLSEKERQAKEYQELKDSYAKLERDYNNLLDRITINKAKCLLGNKGRAQELEGLLAEVKKEREVLEKDNVELANKSLGLEENARSWRPAWAACRMKRSGRRHAGQGKG